MATFGHIRPAFLNPYLFVNIATRGPLANVKKIKIELVKEDSALPTPNFSLILGSNKPKE